MIKFFALEFVFGIAISALYFIDRYLQTITSFYRVPTGITFWITLFVLVIITSTLKTDFELTKVQNAFGFLFMLLPLIVVGLMCNKWL